MAEVAELAMPTSKRKTSDTGMGAPVAESRPNGRPPKPSGSPVQMRVDPDIVQLAKVVTGIEGGTMTDLVSRILRPILEDRARKAGKKFLEERG